MGKKQDLTFQDLMGRKKKTIQKVTICLDPELAEARNVAVRELGGLEIRALRAPDDEALAAKVAAAKKEKEKAEAAADEASVEFTFHALGRKVLEAMMKAHRPSQAQVEEFRQALKDQGLPASEKLSYDPDTFPPALIAASCSEPEMTVEQARELWDSPDFSSGELGQLFQAAWNVSQMIVR